MAQIVYYATAAAALGGRPVSFAVPTGNFGNVLAGWIARRTGAPIDRLLDRFQLQRHPHPLPRRPAIMTTADGRADAEPEHGHPGLVELRAPAVRDERPRRRDDGRAAAPAAGHRPPRRRGRPVRGVAGAGVPGAARFDDADTLDDHARRARRDRAARRPAHRGRDRRGAGRARSRAWPTVALATAHPAKFPDAVERGDGRPAPAAAPPRRPARAAGAHHRRAPTTWPPSRPFVARHGARR